MTAVRVDGPDLAAVAAALQRSGPDLAKEMGKELRGAAAPLRDHLRAAVTGIESKATGGGSKARVAYAMRGKTRSLATAAATGQRHVTATRFAKIKAGAGLRSSVARGIRIEYRAAATSRTTGVTVRSSSAALPPGQKGMAKALNKGRWRHPVFARKGSQRSSWTWATQTVTPAHWWDDTINADGPRIAADIAGKFDAWAAKVAADIARTT